MVTAVITGASSGLGKEYIEAIIAQYPSVDAFWLVARRKELLREIAEAHPDKTIAAISLDLSKEESIDKFEQLLKENNPEIKVLVNNAGYGKCEDFFASNRRSQTGMVDLNCRALTGVTRLCLPFMLDDSLVLNTGLPYEVPFREIDYVELQYNSWELEHQLSYGLWVKVVRRDGRTKRVFYKGYGTAKLAYPADMKAALEDWGIRCIMADCNKKKR